MLDKKDFRSIRKDLERFEKDREEVISKSRDIIKMSKQIIYALHRNDVKKADKLSGGIKKKIKNLSNGYYDSNMNKVAVQEYVEALCYLNFVKNKKIPSRKQLGVETDDYLCGLCDLTGELVRKAVNEAIKKNYKEVLEIRALIDEIYEEFLMFDLRNSELRKKMDAIKWNLRKVEDLVLTAKTRGLV